MSVKTRVLELLQYYSIGQAAFEKKVGVSNGYINNLKDSPGSKVIDKIAKAYPNVNIAWLLSGDGEILKSDAAQASDCRSDVILIPLLPLAAQGGSLNDFIVSVKSDDCEKIVSPIRGVDFAMAVSGDSMDPEYPSGSKILIKKINEKAFIEWGRVYVLDTCNGSVIKKILPGASPDDVSCVSINPDYPPFQVAFDDVYGMYRVLMLLSEK